MKIVESEWFRGDVVCGFQKTNKIIAIYAGESISVTNRGRSITNLLLAVLTFKNA